MVLEDESSEPSTPKYLQTLRRNQSSHLIHRSSSSSSIAGMRRPQPLRLLIAVNGSFDVAQVAWIRSPRTSSSHIEIKQIIDDGAMPFKSSETVHNQEEFYSGPYKKSQKAFDLCQWADMLVVAPMDHNSIAKMLSGITDSLLLEIIRGWDASKKILIVPGMSKIMWENPMTKRQLLKIGKRMSWVRMMSPILWHFEESRGRCINQWTGSDELLDAIQNQVDLFKIGHDIDIPNSVVRYNTTKTDASFPPEIWTIIMEYVGDWETAMALNIYTQLPKPAEWEDSAQQLNDPHKYMKELAWIILSCNIPKICAKLDAIPKSIVQLSGLCVKLIIKLSLIEVLTYMELHMKDVLRSTFGPALLPIKASLLNRTECLEWWRTSPTFLTKDYTAEALDGASKSGFIDVLEWWRKSGLPLKFTEAALEKSSALGHIHVLEWWKEVSHHSGAYDTDVTYQSDNDTNLPVSSKPHSTLHLLVGKSICAAAQNGQAEVVQWFEESGIPYLHSETVAKLASTNGHVNVLEVWKSLKDEKMVFDNQVLVSPTKNGHVDVLEWWKRSGLKVEYKTCDIEEALEDSVGGELAKQNVKKWWATNGLNLGIQTSEWMKVKTL